MSFEVRRAEGEQKINWGKKIEKRLKRLRMHRSIPINHQVS